MDRRKFLGVVSGAFAAVAGGLGLAKAKPAATPEFGPLIIGTNDAIHVVHSDGRIDTEWLVKDALWKNFDDTPYLIHPIKPCWRMKTLDELADELRPRLSGDIDALGGLNV